jgi:hypothetical protein
MGSRTNFGIATYRQNDLSNICIIMPSMSQKYFYPGNVRRAIIDSVKIDIQEALKDVSGWEGDTWRKTAQEYLPTVILLQADGSEKGSFVINYLKSDKGKIYYRIFSFEEYKTVDIDKIETDLIKEMKSGVPSVHSKEHEDLIYLLLIF